MAARDPSAGPDPRRILVRGVNWLGDAVMTTPALLRLRERFPSAHITLLTPEKLADLWRHHPAADEIISFTPGSGLFSIGGKLRNLQFDLALVLPNSPRSALEVWLARIPARIGYTRPWRNFLLTKAVPPRADAIRMRKRSGLEIRALIAGKAVAAGKAWRASNGFSAHQIHEYLHLAAALGANPEPIAPRVVVTPEEVRAAREKFGLENLTGPVFGLNPGAEYGPAKRWPAGRFAEAARRVQARTHCVWLIFGGNGDREIADRMEAELRGLKIKVSNLAGRTSLRELMVLLRGCRVLLTNDSGPMHVAAALGTPVVVPFGSTAPELTGPGLPGCTGHHLLTASAACSPCFLRECPVDFRCMNGISVDRVVQALIQAAA
jgi:heptosyltransferase-2